MANKYLQYMIDSKKHIWLKAQKYNILPNVQFLAAVLD